MLASVQIEHEVGKRALQASAEVPIDGEARTGDFGGTLKVEYSELLSQLPMRLGLEIEPWWRAPAADLDVLVGARSHRHAVMGDIRNPGQNVSQARFQISRDLFYFLNLLPELLGLIDLECNVLAALLQLRNFF